MTINSIFKPGVSEDERDREIGRLQARIAELQAKIGCGETLCCSFCGKSQHEVRKLIAGPTVFICNECVVICVEICCGPESHNNTGAGV